MTGTPRLFAETPDHRISVRTDLLSEMLRSVRLTGSVFLNACFTAPLLTTEVALAIACAVFLPITDQFISNFPLSAMLVITRYAIMI